MFLSLGRTRFPNGHTPRFSSCLEASTSEWVNIALFAIVACLILVCLSFSSLFPCLVLACLFFNRTSKFGKSNLPTADFLPNRAQVFFPLMSDSHICQHEADYKQNSFQVRHARALKKGDIDKVLPCMDYTWSN